MKNCNTIPTRVSHYGTIHIGDLNIDCVVLDNEEHTRGYIQRQLVQALGFTGQIRNLQILNLIGDFAPNALSLIEKSEYSKVSLPHGGLAEFFPAGVLPDVVSGILDSALDGTLHQKRRHFIQPCKAMSRALAKTGEIALIDEATGYQFVRADNYLNDFFTLVLRERFSDWERRFPPSFYEALFEMLGMQREGNKSPWIIANITSEWVYGVVFPQEVIAEMRKRRDAAGTKLHQWLQDGGLSLLEKQINAVTMIARSSIDRNDFRARCAAAFTRRNQQRMFFGFGGAA
ncbi:P63C domain-containing protein [Chromatium okenii]|uniref:P63C domain-containing protein n=1 Tax=Chromatium okenii TaxID=61644 RepID=UPI0026F1F082|nr:P63C domain-containing protein [Chromatium okenii]MBV5310810.1 hypothetical protein [Chromatium okenii]